jgi:glycosyltransferase involved in cell wall biosynthesis
MIKVLHISVSSDIGGGPEHIYQLISSLPPCIESHVACPDNGPYFGKFSHLTSGRVTLLGYRRLEVKFLVSLQRYVKKHNIQLLHAHGKGAGIYARLLRVFLGCTVVLTPHGINQDVERGLLKKGYLFFERAFGWLIDRIIYVSDSEYQYAKKIGIWGNLPFRIIYNGTKLISQSQKERLKSELNLKPGLHNRKVVISASRFDYQKNTLQFCEIALKLPEFVFILLGNGQEKEKCIEFCQANNVKNVFFIGAVDNPMSYFACADIYLSTSRWEGLSMAILEAMSLGLPTVATNVVGNIDLVKQRETGFLYDIGNIEEAVECLRTVLGDKYNFFSSNALASHREMFSSIVMGNATADMYMECLQNESSEKQ